MPGGHPGRRLPGRGPLEHLGDLVEAVLLHAGQVGVPGPGLGEPAALPPGAGRHRSSHLGHSVLAISIPTGDPIVRPWSTPEISVTSSCSKRIRGSPPVAEAPPGQLGLDVLDGEGQPGGQALDDDEQGLAVALAGGQEAQHAAHRRPAMAAARRRPMDASRPVEIEAAGWGGPTGRPGRPRTAMNGPNGTRVLAGAQPGDDQHDARSTEARRKARNSPRGRSAGPASRA